jgi:hypothetical protein
VDRHIWQIDPNLAQIGRRFVRAELCPALRLL